MGIWEILGIDPTTDKKQIKRAYAARSKEVHPEEKPEEFRMLHEAYQKALKYTGALGAEQPDIVRELGTVRPESVEGKGAIREEKGQMRSVELPSVTKEDIEGAELRSYFQEKTEKQEEKIAFFSEKWKAITYERWKPEVRQWWGNYLNSADFQDIQWHPKLLKLLAEEMDKQLSSDYEIRLLFWEAYGFDEKASNCKGDLQKLRRALYSAWERQSREQEREQERERLESYRQLIKKKNRRSLPYILLGMIGIGCFYLALARVNDMRDKIFHRNAYSEEAGAEESVSEPELVKAYLEEKYPGTEFSEPKRAEKYTTKCVYEIYPLSHPDIMFEAVVRYGMKDSSIPRVKEEYGQLLMENYAEAYGLKCKWITRGKGEWPDLAEENDGVSVIFYEDLDTLDEFCDTVIRMFRENEELQSLGTVGICKIGVHYKGTLIGGGIGARYPGEGQLFRPWELEADQMSKMIREGYRKYMVYFEPWNLPLEQCLEWRAGYEEESEGTGEDFASGFRISLPGKGGDTFEIYIPVYIYDTDRKVRKAHVWSSRKMILAGDAYYYLLSKGVAIEPAWGGIGFNAEKDGEFYYLGLEPEVELEEVENIILE